MNATAIIDLLAVLHRGRAWRAALICSRSCQLRRILGSQGLLPRRLADVPGEPVLSWGGGPGASVVLHLDFHVASWTSSPHVSWSRREEVEIASLEG